MNLSNLWKIKNNFSISVLRRFVLLIWFAIFIFTLALPIQNGSGNNLMHEAESLPQKGVVEEANEFSKSFTDQIIIKYVDAGQLKGVDADSFEQKNRLLTASGLELTYVREMSGGAHIMKLPDFMGGDILNNVIEKILTLPEVAYAEPDAIMMHTLTPNDPRYTDQWHYFTPTSSIFGINMPQAWDLTLGSSDVVVAVVDTGITNHAEFSGRAVPGYDFISDVQIANDGDGRDNNASDPGDWITSAESASGYFEGCPVGDSSWHGSHVAGTIAASSNNGVGVAGINWNAKILPVRVLGKCGGYTSDIVDGMRWAAGLSVSGVPANANPANVINISLGGSGTCSTTFQNAINAINAENVTVVTAAGNGDTNASNFQPANCNGVITVAATSKPGNKAYYSNYGATVEISAPGGDAYDGGGVLSTINTGTQGPVGDTYDYYQGTSMAAPHVSGVVSLLYGVDPSVTPSEVLSILQNTATAFPAGSDCTTSICGSGIVNAYSAVNMALPSSPSTPTGLTASDGTYTDKVRLTWNTSSGATFYEVYRNTSNTHTGETKLTGSQSASTYDDTSAVAGTTYYYWVKACNASGCSGYSSSDTGYRAVPIPAAPSGVAASDGLFTDKVRITWNSSSGATYFQVFRNTGNTHTGEAQLTASIANSPMDDFSAVAGTTYYYWVKACNASGCSGYSSFDTGWRKVSSQYSIYLPLVLK